LNLAFKADTGQTIFEIRNGFPQFGSSTQDLFSAHFYVLKSQCISLWDFFLSVYNKFVTSVLQRSWLQILCMYVGWQ